MIKTITIKEFDKMRFFTKEDIEMEIIYTNDLHWMFREINGAFGFYIKEEFLHDVIYKLMRKGYKNVKK